jgi:biotin carboxyl carrier protein
MPFFTRRPVAPVLTAVLALGLLGGCGLVDDGGVQVAPQAVAETVPPTSSTTTTTTSSTTTTPTTTTPTTTPTTSSTTTTTSSTTTTTSSTTTTVPDGPVYTEQDHTLFATAGPVELFHPARRVELIGFHEAGHDGSQQQTVAAGAAPSVVLESRGRNTGSRTAADLVVDPDIEIRSPVTGTVIRGGTYVLYCDHSDDFLVIEPDAAPGWEVKIFHIDGLLVGVGDRVEAGRTPIAPHATRLPFESQVDEFTVEPSNPHVHVEVVDPSIPDIPTPGSGC